MNAREIAMATPRVWTGSGNYWLTDGQRSLELGACEAPWELLDAVTECIEAGTDAECWDGWKASK